MKLLTLNFLTCAIKSCKTSTASFPLHMKDCSVERAELAFQPTFVRNILPRIHYDAMASVCQELGLSAMLPEQEEVERIVERRQAQTMEGDGDGDGQMVVHDEDDGKGKEEEADEEEVLRKLHTLLLETSVLEGRLVCGNCGFEYPVKEGVGNFLLPSHLV